MDNLRRSDGTRSTAANDPGDSKARNGNTPKPKKVMFQLNTVIASKAMSSKANMRSPINGVKKSSLRTKKTPDSPKYTVATPKPEHKTAPATVKSKDTPSKRYRFLNDGIIEQCRKWERLQNRAEALEKHKKKLSELRWKMVLSANSKKFNLNSP